MGVYKYDATNDSLIPIAGISVPGIEDKVSTYTADATYWDTSPSSASSKPVTSGGIFTALADKADATDLANKVSKYSSDATQWDTSPTSASTKPVTSGGVYTGLSGKAPTNHASTATTYGAASMSNYGHVKLSDNYTSSAGTADQAIGASSKAVYDAYNNQNSNKANQTVIATRQANLTASKAYVVGEQFIYNNTLYEVTAAISKNAAITIGGNCKAADNITTQISNNANWVLVDPIASISGSAGGAKPIFYQRGKELLMINFPHPANAATTVTITFKSAYKFVSNVGFGVLNYSSWNKDYQVTLEYYINASTNVLTSNATTMFNYFMLHAPVVFPLA